MRRGLKVQVPSTLLNLQQLKNGPLILASPLTTTTLPHRPIRHPSLLSMTISKRHFSFTNSSPSIVRIPIRFQRKKASNESTTQNSIQSSTNPASQSSSTSIIDQSITSTAFLLIHKQLYDDLLPFLIKHKSKLTSEQLEMILKELEVRGKYQTIINLHKKFPGKSFDRKDTVTLLLRILFKSHEYSLFEVVFSRYLESPNLKPRYCNMGLKAVIYNGNQEFAKQLLYQMVYSHLPMNHATLKVFLDTVQKSGTFQSVRFAVDLIKKNPHVPVDDDTFSTLIKSYAMNASGEQMERLREILGEREVDLYEVDLYEFYVSLRRKTRINYEDLWASLDEIKSKISNKPRLLKSFHVEMLEIFAEKQRREDMHRLVSQFPDDSVEFSDKVNSILFKFFASTGDVEGLLAYFESFKQRHVHIQPNFIHTLWKTLIANEPALAKPITEQVNQFLFKHYSKSQLTNKFLKSIALKKPTRLSLPPFVPVISNPQVSETIEKINEFSSQKRDVEIIAFINDELRKGLKPDFLILIRALIALIKMGSPESIVIYKLGYQLHSHMISEFDLVWLKKSLNDLKMEHQRKSQVYEAGTALIGDFKLKYGKTMTHTNYNDLANLAIDVFNYDLAIQLLHESRASTFEVEKRNNMNLYITMIRALSKKRDAENVLRIMDLICVEEGLKITKFCLTRLRTARQFFVKRNVTDKFEAFDAFLMNFDDKYAKIREKYGAQKTEAVQNYRKAIEFFEEWNRVT